MARAVAFEEGGVTFEILWPVPSLGQEFPDGDLNDASVVLLMTFGDVSFLLTGDIEEGGANALLNAGISADVLKVPHQGSRTTPLTFLKTTSAGVAVISVGEDNRFGHPVAGVLDALKGSAVYRTNLHGRVTVSTDGTAIRVSTER